MRLIQLHLFVAISVSSLCYAQQAESTDSYVRARYGAGASTASTLIKPEDIQSITEAELARHTAEDNQRRQEYWKEEHVDSVDAARAEAIPKELRALGTTRKQSTAAVNSSMSRRYSQEVDRYREQVVRDAKEKARQIKSGAAVGNRLEQNWETPRTSRMVPAYAATDPVLSLIVDAQKPEHVAYWIDEMLRINRETGVPVGQVVVLGFAEAEYNFRRSTLQAQLNKEPIYTKTVNELKNRSYDNFSISPLVQVLMKRQFVRSGSINPQKLAARLQLSSSPTWIVYYQGVDYLFEGNVNFRNYFDYSGAFIPPNGTPKPRSTQLAELTVPRDINFDDIARPLLIVSRSKEMSEFKKFGELKEFVFTYRQLQKN